MDFKDSSFTQSRNKIKSEKNPKQAQVRQKCAHVQTEVLHVELICKKATVRVRGSGTEEAPGSATISFCFSSSHFFKISIFRFHQSSVQDDVNNHIIWFTSHTGGVRVSFWPD